MSISFDRLKNHINRDSLADWFDRISHESTAYARDKPSLFYAELAEQKTAYIQDFVDNFRYTHSEIFYENLKPDHTLSFVRQRKECILYNCELFHEDLGILVKPTLIFSKGAFQSIFTLVKTPLPDYIVCDILYKNLHFTSDGDDLLNQGSLYYRKCKMWVATKALSPYMKDTSQGFVFGKEYRHKDKVLPKKQTIGIFPLKEEHRVSVSEALAWIRKLEENYDSWLIYPKPSVKELYPNMNVRHPTWHKEKHRLAELIKEITLVWNIGYTKRCILLDKEISRWDDPVLLSQMYPYEARESHAHRVQEQMIQTNSQKILKIQPSRIQDPDFKEVIMYQSDSIILDIESVGDLTEKESYFSDEIRESTMPKICIIGTILNQGECVFKDFTIRYLTLKEEETIVGYWVSYLKKRFKDKVIKVYHWGHAEVTYLTYMRETYPKLVFPELQMIDLLTFFRAEPITIKGCFGYGLKEIVKQLYNLKLIDTTWSEDITGLDAMSKILEVSKKAQVRNIPIKRFAEIKKIITYNYYDCRVIVDLLRMLEKMV